MFWLPLVISALIPQGVLGAGSLELGFSVKRGETYVDVLRRGISDSPDGIYRRDSVSVDLSEFEQTAYVLDLQLGSGKENVTVLIDTGSSDLWVMAPDVICIASSGSSINFEVREEKSSASGAALFQTASTCTGLGSFNTGLSSSYKTNVSAPPFLILYLDGTGSLGTWGSDHVGIGNATIKNATFAVANTSTTNCGILGVGLIEQESSLTGLDTEFSYNNLPYLMRSQGVIEKVAYSLYLNEDGELGIILFGAVDHSKYSGDLVTLPILKAYGSESTGTSPGNSGYYGLQVALNLITIDNGATDIILTSNLYPALLDLGSTSSLLPPSMFANLVSILGGVFDETYQAYFVDCGLANNLSMVFEFGGQKIPVPMSEVVQSVDTTHCVIGMLGGDNTTDYVLLGDNVLRHMYVVYDLEDHQISVAKAAYSNDAQIEVISSSVPGASIAPNYSSSYIKAGLETSVTAVATANSASSTKSASRKPSSGSASATSSRSKAGAGSNIVGQTGSLLLVIFAALILLA